MLQPRKLVPPLVLVLVAALSASLPIAAPHGAWGAREFPFQFVFITRAETDVLEGSTETISGDVESLQAPIPGVIVGSFVEEVLLDESDFAPDGYPAGSAIVKIRDVVTTSLGKISYEGRVAVVPVESGTVLLTSSVEGTITGGTGIFARARGTMTLAGKIFPCEPGSKFCAETNFPIVPDKGVRFDCNFTLSGMR